MSEPVEYRNARITRTMLGFEDHGILTYMLHLDYGGAGPGAGGICLGNRHEAPPIFGEHVAGILKTLEVDEWEQLPGVCCRVVACHSKVYMIGHYLKDQWWTISPMPSEEEDDGKEEAEHKSH